MLFNSILDAVGFIPLIRFSSLSSWRIFKAEFLNPGGSIKDWIARHIVG